MKMLDVPPYEIGKPSEGFAVEIKLTRWFYNGERAIHESVESLYDGSLPESGARELYASLKRIADNTLR